MPHSPLVLLLTFGGSRGGRGRLETPLETSVWRWFPTTSPGRRAGGSHSSLSPQEGEGSPSGREGEEELLTPVPTWRQEGRHLICDGVSCWFPPCPHLPTCPHTPTSPGLFPDLLFLPSPRTSVFSLEA